MRTAHQIFFTGKEQAECRPIRLEDEPAEDNVLIKSVYSAISPGTELANFHEMPNTAIEQGAAYPFWVGYSAVGRVVKTGPGVKTLKAGDTVLVHWAGHCSWYLRPESDVYRLDGEADLKEAAFFHIASFPLLAVRKLQIRLGECTMIAGLGILGLFAVQFARLAGALPVFACDFSPERRKLALELGADAVFDPAAPDFIEQVKAASDGKGPDAVVEVTGRIEALQQALEYINREGRIALLGCTRISDKTIDFYKYVHRRGIHLIGAHTSARPAEESRPDGWTEKDDCRTFVRMLACGRMSVAGMIREIVSPMDAQSVYSRISGSETKPGILFDWREIDA